MLGAYSAPLRLQTGAGSWWGMRREHKSDGKENEGNARESWRTGESTGDEKARVEDHERKGALGGLPKPPVERPAKANKIQTLLSLNYCH